MISTLLPFKALLFLDLSRTPYYIVTVNLVVVHRMKSLRSALVDETCKKEFLAVQSLHGADGALHVLHNGVYQTAGTEILL